MEFTWTSIATWLLHAGLGGSLLMVLTLLAMRRVRQPARRQRLGELGLAAALIVAALCWAPAWLPVWTPSPAPSPDFTWVLTQNDPVGGPVEVPPEALDAGVPAVFGPAAAVTPEAASVDWTAWLVPALVSIYLLGAVCCLLRWLTGVVVLRCIVRASQPAAPALFESFRQGYVGRRVPRLLISNQLRVPVSCGILRPTVILPVALAAPEQAAQRDWIFAHELTHLARRDAWSALLFAMGQTLYFAFPWFWWLKRQVRLCQEYVADAAAVRKCPADEYAEFLLSLTTSPAVPLAATGVSGTTSDLYRRVTMLLQNPVRVELSCPRAWTIGAAGVLLGLAVVAAGVGRAQAPPPNQREILEQLERIQDMVNKLRNQVAEPVKADAKKEEIRVIVIDPSGSISEQPKEKNATSEKRVIRLEVRPEDSKKIAEKEAARALEALKWQRVVEQQAADWQADWQKGIQWRGVVDGQRTDANLKVVLELLKKHQAELKDDDKASKQLQQAIDRLKEVMKKTTSFELQLVHPVQPPPPKLPLSRPVQPPTPPALPTPPLAPVYQYLLAPAKTSIPVAADVELVWTTKAAPQGRLGIYIDVPSELLAEQLNLAKGKGLVITAVVENSVAQKAGLKVNDLLLKINNQTVTSEPESLVKLVAAIKTETPFDIVVLRRGKEETIRGVQLAQHTALTRTPALAALRNANRAQVVITATVANDKLTLQRNEGGVAIIVHADTAKGKHKVTSISIVESGKTGQHMKIEDVPEAHRPKVQQMLELLNTLNLSHLPQSQGPNAGALYLQELPSAGEKKVELIFTEPLPKTPRGALDVYLERALPAPSVPARPGTPEVELDLRTPRIPAPAQIPITTTRPQ